MSAPTSLARTTVLRIIAGQSDAETIIDEAIRGAVDQSRAVCESILRRIASAHKGSIGSIENIYLPHIGVEEVTRWREQLHADRAPQWSSEPPSTAPQATEAIQAIKERERRRGVQAVRLLDALVATALVYPDRVTAASEAEIAIIRDARITFSTEAFTVLRPLFDAVEALRDILYASDGCQGHRNCAHSMEPWQRARQVLQILSTNGVIDY